MEIAALFVQEDTGYKAHKNVDCWPESRDARLFSGTNPVIAHPPCARWCRLAHAVQGAHPHLRVGEDGGLFAFALATVRRCGGVLEHPAYTKAWPAYSLIRPTRGRWTQTADCEWVCEVSQSVYGHRARKRTWLLFVGNRAPADLDWRSPEGMAWVAFASSRTNRFDKPRLRKREASATPPAFRDALINLALYSRA